MLVGAAVLYGQGIAVDPMVAIRVHYTSVFAIHSKNADQLADQSGSGYATDLIPV